MSNETAGSEELHRHARALMGAGRLQEAAQAYAELCRRDPADADAWFFLGTARCGLGEIAEGGACFERTLALNPEHVDAHLNRGNVLFYLERHEEALAAYREVLTRDPGHSGAHNNTAHLLSRMGRLEEAEASYRAAIQANPGLMDAHYNLGNLQVAAHRFAEAAASYRRALALRPDFAACRNNYGRALYLMREFDAAIREFERAIELDPEVARFHINLGAARRERDELAAAEAALARALELAPSDEVTVIALTNLAAVRNSQGRNEETLEVCRRILDMDPARGDVASTLLSCMHYQPQFTPADFLHEARSRWAVPAAAARAGAPPQAHHNDPDPQRRLRIGYVSADLCLHPVAYFLEPVMTHHDRAGVELFCYYNNTVEDDQTALLRSRSDHWRNIAALSDAEAAECMRRDGIDILVDLSGHTVKNRLPVFDLRPAPVQITWLGYYGTTGVPGIDYIIGDPHVIPPGAEDCYSEQVLRMPHCYCCFAPPHHDVDVSPLPGDPVRELLLSGFHNAPKITQQVVAVWARVLQALPQARLFLKYRWFGDGAMRDKLLESFAAHGIGPDRLRLEGYSPRGEVLAAYREVHLALDTFPYNGGTTTVEALWMGVPVVTLRGDRFVQRVGASILNTVGLDELIADSQDDYVAKVVALAGDAPRMQALRAGMRGRMLASPLFDGPRFTRDLEALYRGAWSAWCGRRRGMA